MKISSWLSTGSIALLAMSAVFAVGQETPPPAEPQKETEEPEEELIPVKFNQVSIGYTSFGSRAGLSRYARPTEGLSLHELKMFTPGGPNWPYARLILRGMPEQDSYVDGLVILNHGRTIVRGSRKLHSFYASDWRPADPSEDNETEIRLDHKLTEKIGGFFRYSSKERDGRYPAPRDPEHNRTRSFSGGVQGDALGGNVGVTASDRRTYDDTGAQPTTLQRTIAATYARDFGNALSLEGSAAYSQIEQAGLANAGVRSYALAGALDLGPMSSLHFHFGRQDLELNNVLNAYARKRLVSSARLVHRWPGWSFQFGFKHKETERVRTDQSFVDVPKVNEYDARLAGRLGAARVTLRGSWQDLRETAVMNTFDTRQLLWDDRAMFQAKVDGGNEVFSAYGVYTHKFQQNKQRGVEIGWNNFAIGGSFIFNDSLNGYAEFSYDNYHVQGGSETGQTLDFYFPNSRSASVGLNWAKGPSFSASANLNYYESADVRGTQLTFSLRRKIAADHELELVVAPWRHDDRLFNITGYRTTFLMAKYTVKF